MKSCIDISPFRRFRDGPVVHRRPWISLVSRGAGTGVEMVDIFIDLFLVMCIFRFAVNNEEF